mmetsp:Transcript_92951/g.265358  ORF Transcript_92951/g.265358 Transcript_92951/m.265358 type:complete len:92 (+) Transcript_92951:52-327(+)
MKMKRIEEEGGLRRRFRELLWFWREYYSHRGKDRASLEFSSRIPYREWYKVLLLLTADDGSPTALLPAPIPLPDSPFERPAGDSTRQFVPS